MSAAPVELYPAIDLLGGRVVRLTKGDFDAETVYSDDPPAVAASFAAAGATWIHVVDLDAAAFGRSGEPGVRGGDHRGCRRNHTGSVQWGSADRR